MNALFATGAGLAYLTIPMWGRAAAAAGVPVPAHVTAAHRSAMGALRPVLGVTVDDPRAELEANVWWGEHRRDLLGLRGFVIDGSASLARLSASDVRALLDALLGAAAVGVGAGGYKLLAEWGGAIGEHEANRRALARLREGERPLAIEDAGLVPSPLRPDPYARLTSLGAAVLAAGVELRRWAWLETWLAGLAPSVADLRLAHDRIGRLAIELDDQGYRITGAPAPDPEVLDGLAYAADVTAARVGGAVGSVAAGTVGAAATAVIGSRVAWLAAFGFLAWRFLR